MLLSDQPPIDPSGQPPPPAGPSDPGQQPAPQQQPGQERPPPGYGPMPPVPYGHGPAPNRQDELMWATLCHVAAFAGFVIPLGSVLGPLTVWLIKRDIYPFVNDQGKEALNFNLSVLVYAIVGVVLIFAFLIGIPLLIALGIFWLIVTIMGAVAANRGQPYRYPLCIRFIN